MDKNRIDKNSVLTAGRIVQAIVFIAAIITGAGGIAYLVSSGNHIHSYSKFNEIAPFLKSINGIIKCALSFNSEAVMQLGVLVLIAIPLIRVIVFLISFIKERDWIYVAVSAIVMGVLLYSIGAGPN
jgi:uncharacterized membrane protein